MRAGSRVAGLVLALLTVSTVVAAGGGAVATASSAGGGYVYGTITTDVFTGSIDARSYSDDPRDFTGTTSARPVLPVLEDVIDSPGRITCLRIEGKRVGLVYVLEDPSRPAVLRGQALFVTGEDRGPGRRDIGGFVGGPPALFPDCRPNPALFTMPVRSGDLHVVPN